MPLSVSLALYADETAVASTWQVPASHEYEAWSDARAFDGTITIQQPQVRRLYGGHSAQELLAVLLGNTLPEDYALLRDYWQARQQQQGAADFEHFWHERCAGASSRTPLRPRSRPCRAPILRPACRLLRQSRRPALTCCSGPTRLVRDGRFADNPWLLEMPRPFTRLTWDNAALVAPDNGKASRRSTPKT